MKRGLIIFSALVFLMANCRKKELRDFKTYEDLGVIHCLNGVIDSTELGLDCGGGACSPCVQLEAPCVLPNNIIKIAISPFLQSLDVTSTSITTNNGSHTFRAYTTNGHYLSLSFINKADITKMYKGTSDSSFLEDWEVFVKYHGSLDKVGSGDVYVNYISGHYVITCCDFSFSSWGSSAPNVEQNFKITFD